MPEEKQKPADGPRIHIRWMIRRDMPEVLRIEAESFEFPWSEEDFVRCLRQRNCIAMVADDVRADRVLGFMIYELQKGKIHLLNVAVAFMARRQRIGTAMIEKLIAKLGRARKWIGLEVRETNLAAQKFFAARGFRAMHILRGFYEEDETAEDAYFMRYTYRDPGPAAHLPVNRISKFSNEPDA